MSTMTGLFYALDDLDGKRGEGDHLLEVISQCRLSILLLEQNTNVALSISNRAYILKTGRIVKEGPAKELLHDPVVQAAYLGE